MDTKTVSVEQELTGVINMGSIDVIIDPSLDGEAIIEGESNIIDLVELDQNAQGGLVVAFEDGVNVSLSRGVTVRIPAVNGGTIEVDGSGSISLDSSEPLKGNAFHVQIQGSGDISLKVETTNLEVSINGSGDIDISANTQQLRAGIFGSGRIAMAGAADGADISINGSGDFTGENCAVQRANVDISGSGNISVNVALELTGSINGSGDVIYTGDPETVSVSDNGSGDLNKR
jgi:hypothetical protein